MKTYLDTESYEGSGVGKPVGELYDSAFSVSINHLYSQYKHSIAVTKWRLALNQSNNWKVEASENQCVCWKMFQSALVSTKKYTIFLFHTCNEVKTCLETESYGGGVGEPAGGLDAGWQQYSSCLTPNMLQ